MRFRAVFVVLAATGCFPGHAATLSLGEAGTLGIGTALPRIGLECAGTLRGGATRSQDCETPAEVEEDDGLNPHSTPFEEEVLKRQNDQPGLLDE